MLEEREDGEVYFKVNNVQKAKELRELFRFAIEEDHFSHYYKRAGKLIEEVLNDEKEVSFSKEQIDFITGILLFLLSEKRHILENLGITDSEDIDLEVGAYFLVDTQALLSILRRRFTKN
ncbi:MAG: hypothetical protein OEV44_01460 [Spirochaetota bacterium]|nr:hypothetical protein [Spirochaetota bacterium]